MEQITIEPDELIALRDEEGRHAARVADLRAIARDAEACLELKQNLAASTEADFHAGRVPPDAVTTARRAVQEARETLTFAEESRARAEAEHVAAREALTVHERARERERQAGASAILRGQVDAELRAALAGVAALHEHLRQRQAIARRPASGFPLVPPVGVLGVSALAEAFAPLWRGPETLRWTDADVSKRMRADLFRSWLFSVLVGPLAGPCDGVEVRAALLAIGIDLDK